MTTTAVKQKMLDLVKLVHDDLDALVAGLTDEEKRVKGSLQLWSAKDMFTHLTFWGKHFNSQLDKSAKGEKIPTAGDYFNQVNDGILIENIDKPFEEAYKEHEQVYQEQLKKIEGFSEEDLTDLKKFTWLEGKPMIDRILGNACWHPAFHGSDYFVKRGQLDKATKSQETLTEKLQEFPTWGPTALYNLACFYSLNCMKEKAFPILKEAFKGRPDLIEWSKQDSDLDPLREEENFKALYK